MIATSTTIWLTGLLSALLTGCAAQRESVETSPAAEVNPLPVRDGPQQETSGTVPHVQLDIEPDQDVVDELIRRAFLLPGVENRPTIVSLPGTLGMWLLEDVEVVHPEVIVEGREFAHIHPDGSLHAPLPLDRAFEVEDTGWGERHPWADDIDGWDGFTMLYTPRSMEELEVTLQLVIESYNHVTGRDEAPDDYPASE